MQDTLLKKYLDEKNCTKLICGANNENYAQITNLVALYSSAGCKFFDINASIEAIRAYKKGLQYSKINDCCLCISVGALDDPHLSKCKINSALCKKCGKCHSLCLQKAINENIQIDEKKCIGCLLCKNNCPYSAIEKYQKSTPWQEHFEELKKDCACVEFHIMSSDIDEIDNKWKFLCDNFDGFLSISVNHSIFSSKDLIIQLKKMLSLRKPNTTIIQADGIPMSGNSNDYKTTLQALAMTDFIDRANLNTYIHTSGGTNSQTMKLIEQFDINTNGISIGTYARKVIQEYINCEDFLENKEKFNKALIIAKEIIKSTKRTR